MDLRQRNFFEDPEEDGDYEQIHSTLKILNSKFEDPVSKISRFPKPKSKISKRIQFPEVMPRSKYNFDQTLNQYNKRKDLTPIPPQKKSQKEIMETKMVKNFSKKYRMLWVFLSKPNHTGRDSFRKLYDSEKKDNNILENMLTKQNADNIFVFAREGMEIKLMCDHQMYEEYLKGQIKNLNQNSKVLEIHLEDNEFGEHAMRPLKKIKCQSNFEIFIAETVEKQILETRRDAPYYNFIHMDSTAQLFTRRSIIQDCLYSKSKEEYLNNHEHFITCLQQMLKKNHQERFNSARNGEQREMIDRWRNGQEEKHRNYGRRMKQYLEAYYPFEDLSDQRLKETIYSFIIQNYKHESKIYPAVNNTFRLAENSEKFKPISTFTRYLYEAIRHYFTKNYRQIIISKVYRGARISTIEQNTLRKGRYLWNLGFMSTSKDPKVAEEFMEYEGDENVLMIIEFSKLTNNIEYLWDQEGYYEIQKIPELIIEEKKLKEQQVLFNPLNVFEIVDWDDHKKILKLQYAPQLQIIDKKKRKPLNTQENKLLNSITKFTNREYDKGIELLETGKPTEAIRYFERSEQIGENLSFAQKSAFIESLKEVGDIEKMDSIIKHAIEEEEKQKKLLEADGEGEEEEQEQEWENFLAREKEKVRIEEMEREKQRLLEIEKEKQKQRLVEIEREKQRSRLREAEREIQKLRLEKKLEQEKQRLLEIEKEKQRIRLLEVEREKQRQKQRLLKIEKEQQQKRRVEIEKKKQQERLLAKQNQVITAQRITTSMEIARLSVETSNYDEGNKMAEIANKLAKRKSQREEIPSQEVLILESKSYIELANVKYKISETLSSLQESIRSFRIIDEIPNITICLRLHSLREQVKNIRKIYLQAEQFPNLHKILTTYHEVFDQDIEYLEKKTLERRVELRNAKNLEKQLLSNSELQEGNFESQTKKNHHLTEKMLKNYFQKRDNNTINSQICLTFALASWEVSKINSGNMENMEEKEKIATFQKLKKVREEFSMVRKQYRESMQLEKEAYQVLYRNIYKTNLDIQPCLRSYLKNFFKRYEKFMKTQLKIEGESKEIAEYFWKHGEIQQSYGTIVERSASVDESEINTKTPSEREGIEKLEKAYQIIRSIENSQKDVFGSQFTYKKSQIQTSLSNFYKSQTIEKEEMKRKSLLKKKNSLQPFQNNDKKKQLFSKLLDIYELKKSFYKNDQKINKSLFQIKDSCDKIQVLNESFTVEMEKDNYQDRLKFCYPEYKEIMGLIQKFNQKEMLQKNGNIAKLQLLMASNQYKLGLLHNSFKFLRLTQKNLLKSLGLDKDKSMGIDKNKLLYGSSVYIQAMKLKAQLLEKCGTRSAKEKFSAQLLRVSQEMSEKMNEPLNEAEIKEALGIIYTTYMIRYKEINLKYRIEPFLNAIKIREEYLGKVNKYNALVYTIMVELTTLPQIASINISEREQFYKEAKEIYKKLDHSQDPNLILNQMELESNYLRMERKYPEACKIQNESLMEYNKSPNKKRLCIDLMGIYMKAGRMMMRESKFRKAALQWLEEAYKGVIEIEKYIEKSKFEEEEIKNEDLNNLIKVNYKKNKISILESLIQYHDEYGVKKQRNRYREELKNIQV